MTKLVSIPCLTHSISISCGVCVALIMIAGCGQPDATFESNRVYLRFQEMQAGEQYVAEQKQAVVDAVAAMFGTPDEPHVPAIDGLEDVLDVGRLAAASGRVNSDEYGAGEGLYRQHCVHCHGITGNGRGPTAEFLNPYPRDFTKGTFKFKSTPIGYKPTHDDLKQILVNGINGTAMPSFALLSEGEINALVDYVKYLAVRGETERKLIVINQDYYDPEDLAISQELEADFHSREVLVDEALAEVIVTWQEAADNVTEVDERPSTYNPESEDFSAEALRQSEDRGRKLYYTSTANCYSCHGPSQLGDGQITDYDQWTKEFFDWTNKNAEEYQERLTEYLALDALPPRNIRPRNLRQGIYRGGRRPIDIFWRITNGIDGTPMPAANKSALSDDDIWDLVNYVLSLPYESTSRPGLETATNKLQVN